MTSPSAQMQFLKGPETPASSHRSGSPRGQLVERIALVVEDEERIGTRLIEIAEESGFKGVLARDADTALMLAKQLRPDVITVDVHRPEREPWYLINRLKGSPDTRGIPIDAISAHDRARDYFHVSTIPLWNPRAPGERLKQILSGVPGYDGRSTTAMVIANGDADRVSGRLRADGFEIAAIAKNAKDALDCMARQRFDCVVASEGLPDMRPGEMMEKMVITKGASGVPLLVYGSTFCDIVDQEGAEATSDIILVRNGGNRDAILGEVRQFLQYNAANPVQKKARITIPRHKTAVHHLAGRKVLIVDDDVRNIFALEGALDQHGMVVLSAENGRDAIEMLKQHADSDAVLMDIMMPELDGYDTMRVIRGMEPFQRLPIIAITARAMQGDREKCIEAGASDYIAKPVDIEQLLMMLECWLKK